MVELATLAIAMMLFRLLTLISGLVISIANVP